MFNRYIDFVCERRWGIGVAPIAGLRNGEWKMATAFWRGRVSFAKPDVEGWSN